MPTGPMLEDKVAIVTGIGPGMGRSIALALAREGADVVLAARREERCDAVAEEVRDLGRIALVMPTDIADPGQCDELVDATSTLRWCRRLRAERSPSRRLEPRRSTPISTRGTRSWRSTSSAH